MNDVTAPIEKTNDYLEELSTRFGADPPIRDCIAYLHVLDHLRRINNRMGEDRRLRRCRDDEFLATMSDRLTAAAKIFAGTTRPLSAERAEEIRAINHELKDAMR